ALKEPVAVDDVRVMVRRLERGLDSAALDADRDEIELAEVAVMKSRVLEVARALAWHEAVHARPDLARAPVESPVHLGAPPPPASRHADVAGPSLCGRGMRPSLLHRQSVARLTFKISARRFARTKTSPSVGVSRNREVTILYPFWSPPCHREVTILYPFWSPP